MLALFNIPHVYAASELITFCCFVFVAIVLLATGGRKPRGYAAGVISCPLVFLVLAYLAVNIPGSKRPEYFLFVRNLATSCAVTTSIVCSAIAMLKTEREQTKNTDAAD